MTCGPCRNQSGASAPLGSQSGGVDEILSSPLLSHPIEDEYVSIPDYQQFMLPLLQYLSDGQVRTRQAYKDWLADHFHLTPAEREGLLPSGRTTMLSSRAGWAATYLVKASLVQRPQRGQVQITDRGLESKVLEILAGGERTFEAFQITFRLPTWFVSLFLDILHDHVDSHRSSRGSTLRAAATFSSV